MSTSKSPLSFKEIEEYLKEVPDEVLSGISFTMPWQYDTGENTYRDPDGFNSAPGDLDSLSRTELQKECWRKYHQNPQINTAIRGIQGRLAGFGFGVTCWIWEIQEVIEEIENDFRNRLYNYIPKFVGRSYVEGELFLLFSIHPNGFVEIDFLDPQSVSGGGTGNTGIIFHSEKTTLPLFYNIRTDESNGLDFSVQIPSIYIAHDPTLALNARKHKDYKVTAQKDSRSRAKAHKSLGGFKRFVVAWDRGLITRRTTSYLRTTLEWINQYELLKKYEIEHKRSQGAYIWVFTIENVAMYRLWLGLSDEDRRKTGIMAKKTPGGSLVLPPGVTVEAKNPQLSQIRDEDTDILQMVTSGLNEEEGVTTGRSRSTFASSKSTSGPMTDRVSDEIAWFEKYLRFDFWGSVFLLRSKVGKMSRTFPVEQCVGYEVKEVKKTEEEKDAGSGSSVKFEHTPVFKTIRRKAEMLIDFTFPTSETVDYEGRAKGMLGTKHGPVSDTLGIPNSEVASRMGFGGYGHSRLVKETENKRFPKLVYNLDAESIQEKKEAEPPKKQEPKKQEPKK